MTPDEERRTARWFLAQCIAYMVVMALLVAGMTWTAFWMPR